MNKYINILSTYQCSSIYNMLDWFQNINKQAMKFEFSKTTQFGVFIQTNGYLDHFVTSCQEAVIYLSSSTKQPDTTPWSLHPCSPGYPAGVGSVTGLSCDTSEISTFSCDYSIVPLVSLNAPFFSHVSKVSLTSSPVTEHHRRFCGRNKGLSKLCKITSTQTQGETIKKKPM